MKAVLCSSNLTCWGIHLETEDCKRRTGRTGRLLQIIIITAKVRLKIWKWCRKRPSKFFSGLKNLTMRFQNLSLQNLLERRHLSAFQSIFPSVCMYRHIKKKNTLHMGKTKERAWLAMVLTTRRHRSYMNSIWIPQFSLHFIKWDFVLE